MHASLIEYRLGYCLCRRGGGYRLDHVSNLFLNVCRSLREARKMSRRSTISKKRVYLCKGFNLTLHVVFDCALGLGLLQQLFSLLRQFLPLLLKPTDEKYERKEGVGRSLIRAFAFQIAQRPVY